MPADPRGEAKRLWLTNESLWKKKVEPQVLIPLESKGGVTPKGSWQQILSVAFGRTLETFQAVQRLCDPNQTRQFWADAFVLTRCHFETLVTMEWIGEDPDRRSQMFLDESSLKEAHVLDVLGDKSKDVIREKREAILREREEVLKKYDLAPGTLSFLPGVQKKVDDLAAPLKHKYPNLKWEYEMFYRDVSGFVHTSAWGLMQSISGSGGDTLTVASTPQVGEKALLWNGGWFLRILKLFNEVFKVIPDVDVCRWQEEWAKAVGVHKSE